MIALPLESEMADPSFLLKSPARKSSRGTEIIGGDVNRLNAFHRRDVRHVVRHGHQNIGSAVHARVVVTAVLAVEVECEVALGRIDHGVLKTPRRGPWYQVNQALKVAVA